MRYFLNFEKGKESRHRGGLSILSLSFLAISVKKRLVGVSRPERKSLLPAEEAVFEHSRVSTATAIVIRKSAHLPRCLGEEKWNILPSWANKSHAGGNGFLTVSHLLG